MLSGLDTAGKDLPALAELQQANDNLKAHCDLWLESPLQTHVGHVPVLRRHSGKVTCASVLCVSVENETQRAIKHALNVLCDFFD